jgi:hypothetical protein
MRPVSARRSAKPVVVLRAIDGGKQNLFGGALLILVLARDLLGEVICERVWVKVDEGAFGLVLRSSSCLRTSALRSCSSSYSFRCFS